MKATLLSAAALLTAGLALVPTAGACADRPLVEEAICTATGAAGVARGIASKAGQIGVNAAMCFYERAPADWDETCDVTP